MLDDVLWAQGFLYDSTCSHGADVHFSSIFTTLCAVAAFLYHTGHKHSCADNHGSWTFVTMLQWFVTSSQALFDW